MYIYIANPEHSNGNPFNRQCIQKGQMYFCFFFRGHGVPTKSPFNKKCYHFPVTQNSETATNWSCVFLFQVQIQPLFSSLESYRLGLHTGSQWRVKTKNGFPSQKCL